nr:FAD-dependent oxidoreductase [Mesorhizobium sp. BH1-1-5]
MNQASSFQVAVIGGGITGASAANHLAAAGFRTVLLERGDFASGTSSRSSRLQHCGLTYFSPGRSIWNFLLNPRMAIEHLELARRAMRDRSRFVRATPERVRPVRFYTPLYRNDGIPAWKARLGFRLLELLDPGGVPLDFELLRSEEAASEPALRHLRDRQDLVGAVKFTEYQFDWPERICLDTVMNARDCGAQVRNYAEVVAIRQAADGRWHLDVADRRGRAEEAKSVSTVVADCIVNATGAWVDETASRCGLSVPRVNQGLKGTNIVVRLPDEFRSLAVETACPMAIPSMSSPGATCIISGRATNHATHRRMVFAPTNRPYSRSFRISGRSFRPFPSRAKMSSTAGPGCGPEQRARAIRTAARRFFCTICQNRAGQPTTPIQAAC